MKRFFEQRLTRTSIYLAVLITAFGSAARAGGGWVPPAPGCPLAPLSTIPTWNVLSSTGWLCFIGTVPASASITIINVPVVPIVVKLLDGNGTVAATLNPTKPLFVNPTNNPSLNAFDATIASPIFAGHDYVMGPTTLGTMQWGQATLEASFWKYPGVDFAGWSVSMAAFPFPTQTLTVPFGSWEALSTPHSYAVDSAVLDPFLFSLGSLFPGQMPILLTYNILEYPHGAPAKCCTTGYHHAYTISSVYSFYIWAAYLDAPAVNSDVFYLSHEVAEFMHDPFVNNAVQSWPASFSFPLPWSPPYTFTKCQSNLEVGDPVEDRLGTPSEVQYVITNSMMTYHLQNVVTASWQMQASPSFSVNGWYTLKGAVDGEFAAPAPACL